MYLNVNHHVNNFRKLNVHTPSAFVSAPRLQKAKPSPARIQSKILGLKTSLKSLHSALKSLLSNLRNIIPAS